MTEEEILQAILDKKQLQEWDGIAEKFFNITENQALSNIVHGKVVSMRTKPTFGYMHYHKSELYRIIELELYREENEGCKEELEEKFREMFDEAMYVFFRKDEE